MPKPLDRTKFALLRVAKSKLGLDEETYRGILRHYGGAESARDLDARGFDDVMTRFRHLGFTSDARRRAFGRRDGMATPGQVQLIRNLWAEVATNPDEGHLNAWLERFGVSALRFVDADRAKKIIAGLKSWRSRGPEKSPLEAGDSENAPA